MINFSLSAFMSLMCVLRSHQHCCSDGTIKFLDSNTDAQDVDGSLIINSNQIIVPAPVHAAKVALQHRVRRCQRSREKHEFIKSLFLANSKRSTCPHCRL